MKVLFVFSGNSKKRGISPIVGNQANSLKAQGLSIDYFPIKGGGLKGYFQNTIKLRRYLKTHDFDIIHSHYSLSGFASALALSGKPIICSLMGSDVYGSKTLHFFIRFCSRFLWKHTIVKSANMADSLKIEQVQVIPNGVNFDRFIPIEQTLAKHTLGWPVEQKHVLFGADPERPVKNFSLAKKAFDMLNETSARLHFLEGVENKEVPLHLNAADVVLLTSKWEGSPNIIKEAMACNRPIVSTRVGDVNELIGKVDGCFVTEVSPKAIAIALEQAISFGSKTKGRESIQGLNDKSIAQGLIKLYQKTVL